MAVDGSPQLAIVTASGPAPRAHVALSIENPINPELVRRHFSGDLLSRVERLNNEAGFFAWGATPGPGNERNWNRLNEGDYVLVYQSGRYTFHARVLTKDRNREFARALWGTDDANGTWELMYFLSTPQKIDVPTDAFPGILPAKYQGFTLIPEDRMSLISAQYGSLEAFVSQEIAANNAQVVGPSARAFWWVNQGVSYRQERDGGYLWAPERTKAGATVSHHSNVKLIKPGDVILHYSQGIRAISVATETPRPSARLEELPAGNWEREGNIAKARYFELSKPIRLEEIPGELRTGGPNSPFGKDGSVKEGYLFRASDELISGLKSLFKDRWPAGSPFEEGDLTIDWSPSTLAAQVSTLRTFLSSAGMIYQPWQVAAYVTAVRTKPFVVLAGISGTGKTKLPRYISEATRSGFDMVAVRPDWTDSSELLGYEALDGKFRPGDLLRAARSAQEEPAKEHFFLLDEMNLARVEYYFAEVLSYMEEMHMGSDETWSSDPLRPYSKTDAGGSSWSAVSLPSNLCIVGSVNMDETTHGFSRKVLDRAFVLEFSEIDLNQMGDRGDVVGADWSAADWGQPNRNIGQVPDDHAPVIKEVISVLTEINDLLSPIQLQVGYRVRDEIALFCVNARACIDSFVNAEGQPVAPLDLAISMKVLPRIQGGSRGVKRALDGFANWATSTSPGYPVTGDRIRLMSERYEEEGFTSFWL